MIRLLQRMDDAEPRLPAGGESTPPPLRNLTVLAEAQEPEEEAVEDFARGLEWVRWLLAGIRRKNLAIHCRPLRTARAGTAHALWSDFGHQRLPTSLRAHFLQAWQASAKGDLQAVIAADLAFTASLSEDESNRSTQAGELLLQATRHARYQGWLGRYRVVCQAGESPGHFLTVWAGVAHFFQLSLASAAAEYLRLEWEMLTWNLPGIAMTDDLPALASRMIETSQRELRLVE
jgi:hypothetical protein